MIYYMSQFYGMAGVHVLFSPRLSHAAAFNWDLSWIHMFQLASDLYAEDLFSQLGSQIFHTVLVVCLTFLVSETQYSTPTI